MSRNLTQVLASLRSDLGDSGSTWSDAELTRCVTRAVADLSRNLPRDLTYEVTVDKTVSAEAFTTPGTEDPDLVVDNVDISGFSAGSTCTISSNTPDVPRPLKLTITDANASITDFILVVVGTGINYEPVTESFFYSGGLVQTGIKYFRTIASVTMEAITGCGASDVLDLGTDEPEGVWIQLANKPIKPGSETVTSYTRNSDYIIDYTNGRIAMKSGGTMVDGTVGAISYTKSTITLDLSPLEDFIRVTRVAYPGSDVPQTFCNYEPYGTLLTLTGEPRETQSEFSDNEHIIVQYQACHKAPTATSPGTYPEFFDRIVELSAAASALFLKAVKLEHQAATDTASARTALGSIAAKHTLAGTALTAAGTAFAAATTALATKPALYTDGGSAPSGLKYLGDGDAFIESVNAADNVASIYADYARAGIEMARAYIAVAEVHSSNGRGYTEQGSMYIYEIDRYLEEASRYTALAESDLALALQYRTDAVERRNEAWSIWRSPGDYRGNFNVSSTRQ